MDIKEEEARHAEFKKILNSLAGKVINFEDEDECRKIYQQLESLYYVNENEQFRHFYSDIFSVLTELNKGDGSGDIVLLATNIGEIRAHYKPADSGKDISSSLRKLYDHVSLDLARMNYSDGEGWEATGKRDVKQLKYETAEWSSHTRRLGRSVQKVTAKIENIQKDFITIFGIFVSVIITFMAGMIFDSSVLENMDRVSPYRLTGIVLLLGCITFNLLYILLRFLYNLVKEDGKWEWGLCKGIFLYGNIVFLISMALVLLAWYFGVAECRNLKILKWFA